MKSKKIILVALFVMFLLGLIYGSYRVFTWKKDSIKESEIKESIKDFVKVINDKTEVEEENKSTYNIDFESLKRRNSDTVAYIKVNNTNIDYVVVQGNDNSYYLNHNFDKEYSGSGWVFADYHNRFDGTDKNIVVYGHSMLNGSMFGTLRKILNKKWYDNEENKYITFVTESGEHVYEVFSVYTIKVEDYYIKTMFNSNSEYSRFLNTIKNRSIKNFGVNLGTDDRVLTLSTCHTGGSYRTVLHAKLVK